MLNNATMTSITGHHFTYMFCLLRMYQAICSVMDWIPNEQFNWKLSNTRLLKIIFFLIIGIQSDIRQPYRVNRRNQSYFCIKILIKSSFY